MKFFNRFFYLVLNCGFSYWFYVYIVSKIQGSVLFQVMHYFKGMPRKVIFGTCWMITMFSRKFRAFLLFFLFSKPYPIVKKQVKHGESTCLIPNNNECLLRKLGCSHICCVS